MRLSDEARDTLAAVAFNAYCEWLGGGLPIDPHRNAWLELSTAERRAWGEAAEAAAFFAVEESMFKRPEWSP